MTQDCVRLVSRDICRVERRDCEIYISQANVATQLRCGGIFNNHHIANFPRVRLWRSVNI